MSDRDRQIWCSHSSTKVRRLGTEQNNNLQNIPRLRASQAAGKPPQAPLASTQELENRLCPQTTRTRGVIGVSSYVRTHVSVVDLQLGRLMGDAELAAHANAWLPSVPMNQDMDVHLKDLLVMLTSGPALQIIRQQPSEGQAFRDCARRYNPRSQARSLAQLQELVHFDFGQEPAGVTDRLIVFETLVGEYETSSGEVLRVQVK